jgi:5-methylcytosine-specific restriction protein A
MPESELAYQEVPPIGPLSVGSIYRRQHLNDRFGGNRMSGIVVSNYEPVILLFHTEEPSRQFYQDGFDRDGLYWYSGEGTSGDMAWRPANRAIRDHSADGKDLLLFERVQRKDGLWRFSHQMRYFDHKIERRPDREGNLRDAIVFALLADDSPSLMAKPAADVQAGLDNVSDLRQALSALMASDSGEIIERIQRMYQRSALVARYARARANGVCEACNLPAPFQTVGGDPFLEVHHIERLADGGADRCDRVAAVCPNCHRRCHYAVDYFEYNQQLAARILDLEAALNIGR